MKPKMADAIEWRRATEARLREQIHIERRILDSLAAELAEIRGLDGDELLYQFGWQTPAANLERKRDREAWAEEIKDVFVEAVLQGTW